ncbi:hypothetical protein LX32DRAFT_154922 [Colletotrichum zoysiae]|uniref:Uncharacterized protein n=1 Tax=Colletotrichum zoysiae TaxID=1216348 RepID=A0AAD9HVY3_9PEZI|nr:hypothetical protein LX32DRAFT_154922 [Colletotrichum zoysiae]
MPDLEAGDFNGLFANETADDEDEPEDSVLRPYFFHPYMSYGESGGGKFYHQGRHLASFMHPDDTEYAFPVDEHPQA